MKTLLFLFFVLSSSVYAQDLIVCNNTQFEDIEEIAISSSDSNAVVRVVEYNKNAGELVYTATFGTLMNKGIELSSWSGYIRKLVFDGNEIRIDFSDECTQESVTLSCHIE